MNSNELIEWLFENGGPAIKWRVVNELDLQKQIDMEKLKHDLINSKKAAKSLDDLHDWTTDKATAPWHGSKKECLENVFGKLLEYGFNNTIDEFACMLPLLKKWIEIAYNYRTNLLNKGAQWKELENSNAIHSPLESIYMTWCFFRGGFIDDLAVRFAVERLNRIVIPAKEQIFDIYLKGSELRGISKKCAGSLLRPELNPLCGSKPLPFIHDIYMIAYFPRNLLNDDLKQKINTVIEYILDDRFQQFHEGYGYLKMPDFSFCHSCGWSPHLEGYNGFCFKGINEDRFFIRFELMSHFKLAHKSKWFKDCLSHLEMFKTSKGTYLFPKRYLKEKPSGYYIQGPYMGLEEIRNDKSLEIESTFRMLLIKKRINDGITSVVKPYKSVRAASILKGR